MACNCGGNAPVANSNVVKCPCGNYRTLAGNDLVRCPKCKKIFSTRKSK